MTALAHLDRNGPTIGALQVSKDAIVSPSTIPSAGSQPAGEVLKRVAKIARTLHDSVLALAYDKMIELVAASIPDAKDRLSHIATLNEGAAERTLNAIEMARPIQDRLASDAAALTRRWDEVLAAPSGVDAFKALVARTREFLGQVPAHTYATNEQLTEIMVAQEFQDLSGQIIKKTTDIVRQLENQLLKLLRENTPDSKVPVPLPPGQMHHQHVDS